MRQYIPHREKLCLFNHILKENECDIIDIKLLIIDLFTEIDEKWCYIIDTIGYSPLLPEKRTNRYLNSLPVPILFRLLNREECIIIERVDVNTIAQTILPEECAEVYEPALIIRYRIAGKPIYTKDMRIKKKENRKKFVFIKF